MDNQPQFKIETVRRQRSGAEFQLIRTFAGTTQQLSWDLTDRDLQELIDTLIEFEENRWSLEDPVK